MAHGTVRNCVHAIRALPLLFCEVLPEVWDRFSETELLGYWAASQQLSAAAAQAFACPCNCRIHATFSRGFQLCWYRLQHSSGHFLTGFGPLTGHAFIAMPTTGWVKNAGMELFVLRGSLSRHNPHRHFPCAAQGYCFADKTHVLTEWRHV